MLTGKSAKIQYWILKEHNSLEDIKIFLHDYYEEIIDSNISLYYRWASENNFEVEEYEIDNINIRYLLVYADLDILRLKKEEVSCVPRDIAVGTRRSHVLFVERKGSIIVLVASSKSYFSKIRTKLFKNGKMQWGELSYKDISLEREFFYWLMSKKGYQIQLGTEEYILHDLDAFNCITEREQHQYKGTGQGIDEEAPVGAMVSLKNFFTGLGIMLGNNKNIIKFTLFNNLETDISFLDSHILTDNGFDFFKGPDLVLKIYFQIIPALLMAYNCQRSTWSHDEKEFRKVVALRAIREIMNETELSIQDIEKLAWE